MWGVNSISGSISRSIFLLYLFRVHSISGSSPIYVSLYIDGGSTPSPVMFISILFDLHLHKPYFIYFSSVILMALNDNLKLTISCRLKETSSKMKLLCVPTHYYWSIPFSAVNSGFFKLFHMYSRYM